MRKSPLWNKSWFFLSAIMNAISLINIGTDLRIVVIKWADFIKLSFDFIDTICNYLLYPFVLLLGLFGVEIPGIAKNVFFLAFLFMASYMVARDYCDRFFQKGWHAPDRKKWQYTWIEPFAKSVAKTFAGFCIGILIGLLDWLFAFLFGKTGHFIVLTPVLLFFFLSSVTLTKYGRSQLSENNRCFKSRFKEYMFTVLLSVFLICLLNYFIITFIEG